MNLTHFLSVERNTASEVKIHLRTETVIFCQLDRPVTVKDENIIGEENIFLRKVCPIDCSFSVIDHTDTPGIEPGPLK
jgi:hypothetical protein